MGCPVGIGPEIILKFVTNFHGHESLQPVVIGDIGVLQHWAQTLGIEADFVPWQPQRQSRPGAIMIHQPPSYAKDLALSASDLVWGRPTRATGRVMAAFVEEAVRLALHGDLAAMVTCPITKAALQGAGYDYPGHTELLADLCGAADFAMMMAGASLRVTLVTIHQGLAQVAATLTRDKIFHLIDLTGRSLQNDFGLPLPRLAVAGFNPHAGEGGLFGDEEGRLIAPAIEQARNRGWQVDGPFPPDTVFHKAIAGQFDAVVCMYHDQGLIPFKLLHFVDGVNVTIGLPIVRTSVDHGTAYDIAGQGIANPASLQAAFQMAAVIAGNRRKARGDF